MATILQFGKYISPARRRGGWIVVGFFVAFALGCVLLPASPVDGVVLCPFRRLSGFSCPGCGMTRACVLIFKGAPIQSLAFHPFAWIFTGVFFLSALNRLAENISGRHLRYPGAEIWAAQKNRVLVVSLVILMGFGAGRLILEVAGFLTPV